MIACGVLKHGTFTWFGYMWLETLEESELGRLSVDGTQLNGVHGFLPLHILSWVRHGHPWKDEKGRTF